MLPHLTGLEGALVIRTAVGRAPTYSAVKDDFVQRLQAMASETCCVIPFETVDAFYARMEELIQTSSPFCSVLSPHMPEPSGAEGEKQ